MISPIIRTDFLKGIIIKLSQNAKCKSQNDNSKIKTKGRRGIIPDLIGNPDIKFWSKKPLALFHYYTCLVNKWCYIILSRGRE